MESTDSADAWFLAAWGALLALLTGVFVWDRPVFVGWSVEDGWVEWASFFAWALAAVLCVRRARGHRALDGAGDPLARAGWWGLALLAAFVAGEEVSWGQRVFLFRPPEVFLAHNAQQEANLHNFLRPLGVSTRFFVISLTLFYGVGLAAAARLLRGRAERLALAAAALAPPGVLAPGFVALTLLDLWPERLVGESGELLLGLLLVAGVRRGRAEEKAAENRPFSPRWAPLWLAAPLVLGVLAAGLQPRLLKGEALALEMARAQLELFSADLRSADALDPIYFARLPKVHLRLYELRRSGVAAFTRTGEVGRKFTQQGRDDLALQMDYLLDPWSNSYWLWYKRSYGPNRRRDTDIIRLTRERAQGPSLDLDDLGLWIPVRFDRAP